MNTLSPKDKKDDKKEKDSEILCTAWQDNWTVIFQTTAYTSDNFNKKFHLDTIKRSGIPMTRKEALYLLISQLYKDYNIYMRGMNCNNQMRSYYIPYHQSYKWWWSLFTYVLKTFILNDLILYNIDHSTDSVTHWDFLHTVTIKLTHSASDKSCKKHPYKERNILLLLSKIRSLKHEWIICFSRDYCVVCKDDKTLCPSYSVRSRKRRAPLIKVNENIRVKGKVIEEGW